MNRSTVAQAAVWCLKALFTALCSGASSAAVDALYAEYGQWCTLLGLDAMAESTFDYLASRL